MLISVLLAAAGLLLLLGGGELLLRGAIALAARLGLSPLLIGLSVVAAATSMPELVVTVTSGLQGVPNLGVGNVIGSNIANTLLIVGAAALASPIATRPQHVLRDGLVMLGATLLFAAFALAGEIGRIQGLILLAGLVIYLAYCHHSERRGSNPGPAPAAGAADGTAAEPAEEAGAKTAKAGANTVEAAAKTAEGAAAAGETAGAAARGPLLSLLLIALGVGAMVGGSKLLVDGAVVIAQALGVSDAVIGLTLVAVGTSLPELATAIIAGLRRHSEIALGNAMGSNLFNLLLILGVLALVTPFRVAPEMLEVDVWVMIASAVLLLPIMLTGWRLDRREGAVLLLAYAAYVAFKYHSSSAG